MSQADVKLELQARIDEILSEKGADTHVFSEAERPFPNYDRKVDVPKIRKTRSVSLIDDEGYDEDVEAYAKLLVLVGVQEQSTKRLRTKLKQRGFSSSSVEKALSRAINANIVNDERFTEILISSRVSQGKGFSGIARELRENGVEPDEIEGWPEAFGYDDALEKERARECLDHKPPRSKNPRNSAYQRLMRLGYSSNIASIVAREWAYDIEHVDCGY